ncbi:hypothetical protein KUCAC02_001126, partial [Chaenocephalus aceratus]
MWAAGVVHSHGITGSCVCLVCESVGIAPLQQQMPACGGVYDATEAGYITSPGYPLEYPPHQNCHWIITVPEPSQRIVLNFNPHFEIERLDCKHGCVRAQRCLHVFTVLCEGRGAAEVEGSPSWSSLRICMTAGTAEQPELCYLQSYVS